MYRIGILVSFLALLACNNEKTVEKKDGEFSIDLYAKFFRSITPPYAISDTGLLKNKDTSALRSTEFASFLPEEIIVKLFGKGAKVKYIPLASIRASKGVNYYIIKAMSGNKKIALLLAFENNQMGGVFPFLVPDNDPFTSQVSSIDRSFSILKNVSQKKPDNITAEGKEVYEYDTEDNKFLLIMANPINTTADITNPIDTFSRKSKFSGDYVKDKKNYISIRDGRYPNQLRVFIHLEKTGGCSGDLKGDLLLTSTSTAIYRQGGDPCVLSFRFMQNSVSIKEDEGCGSHRGVDCVFDGTFPRKKIVKPKSSTKKK